MEQRVSSTKLIIGVFLAALGLLMTLDNLDVIVASRYIRWWPMLFILIGLAKLNNPASRGPAIVAMVVGVVLLALNSREVSIGDLWPLILIGAGIFIVVQSMGGGRSGPNNWVAVLTQRKTVITAPNFAGGNATAFLGGCEVDLTGADITVGGPAVIDVFALMGGIEIRVPDGWEVLSDVIPFMGGVEVKTRSHRSGRQLLIRGFVMMAGLEVKA